MCQGPWCARTPSSSSKMEPVSPTQGGCWALLFHGVTDTIWAGMGDGQGFLSCQLHLNTGAHWALRGRLWPGTQDQGRAGCGALCQEASQQPLPVLADGDAQSFSGTTLTQHLPRKQPAPHRVGQRERVLRVHQRSRTTGGTRHDSHQQEGQRTFISISNSQTGGRTVPLLDPLGHPAPARGSHSTPPGATPTTRLTPWERTVVFRTPM